MTNANQIAVGQLSAALVVDKLLRLHDVFSGFARPNLAETPQNNAYRQLTQLAYRGAPYADTVLDHPRIIDIIPHFRGYAAMAKANEESSIAHHMVGLVEQVDGRQREPYDTEVKARVRALCAYTVQMGQAQQELALWRKAQVLFTPEYQRRRLLFVGAGALPLSGFAFNALARHHDLTLLDHDNAARHLGQKVIRQASLQAVFLGQSGQAQLYRNDHLVLVARDVGNKLEVLKQIGATAPQAVAAFRTVAGLHSVLYVPLDLQQAAELGWQPMLPLNPCKAAQTVTLRRLG